MQSEFVFVCFIRQVAIKIIDTRKIKDEYQRANLHREARVMAILRHPNIIRLYETLKVGTRGVEQPFTMLCPA